MKQITLQFHPASELPEDSAEVLITNGYCFYLAHHVADGIFLDEANYYHSCAA
jgi:hypothetical protein